MDVPRHALHRELDVADPAKPRVLERHLAVIHVAELPEAGVAPKPRAVLPHEAGKMNAPDLLLPLDHEFDPARQPARLLEKGVDREQARREVSLVVAHATPEEASVAPRGRERRAGPEVDRLRRLHVVVVVDEQGFVAFAVTLGDHHGVALGGNELHGEAARAEHLGDEARALLHAEVLGRDTGLGRVSGELGQALLEMIVQVPVDRGEIGHGGTHDAAAGARREGPSWEKAAARSRWPP